MKRIHLIIISALTLLLCNACDTPTNTNEFKTQEISFKDIDQTPGFTWFTARYNIYKSNTDIIQKIKSAMKPDLNFYLFAQPSCNCETLQNIFPNAMRVIHDASITNANYRIIVMKNKDAENPYKNFVTLKELPEIFLVKNNAVIYSISDTVKQRGTDSTLIKSGKASMEQVILEALELGGK